MIKLIRSAIESLLMVALVVFSLNFLLSYTGITITIGKQQKPEIYIYPQGSQEQRL